MSESPGTKGHWFEAAMELNGAIAVSSDESHPGLFMVKAVHKGEYSAFERDHGFLIPVVLE